MPYDNLIEYNNSRYYYARAIAVFLIIISAISRILDF